MQYDIPRLLDHFIEYTCYLLAEWGFDWWEGTSQTGATVPWIIEFQKRKIIPTSDLDSKGMMKSNFHNDVAEENVYRIDLKTVFNKRMFQSLSEIREFVPSFLRHFIWGTQKHQDYFWRKIGLGGSSRQDDEYCETYLQVKVVDDRTLREMVEKSPLFERNIPPQYHRLVDRKIINECRDYQFPIHDVNDFDQEDAFFSPEDRVLLELASFVLERKENLNLLWGVGCEYSYNKVKRDPLFPLLPLKRSILKEAWYQDLEKRWFKVACFSLWNDQVLILADDSQSLAELYMMESRFLSYLLSILGGRCPFGPYFVGLLNESSLVIIRRALPDGSLISKEACLTFFRRLGYFIKNGKIPMVFGKCDLYLCHDGMFFEWKERDLLASLIPNFELVGVEDLSTISVSPSALEHLYRHYHKMMKEVDEEPISIPENHETLLDFFDERNPFSWRYFDQWFRQISSLSPEIERLLRDFNMHIEDLPILLDYFPENPLEDVDVPIFWAFSFQYAIRMGDDETRYVSLEDLWSGFYRVQDLRKFQLALILAQKLLVKALNLDYDDIKMDFQIPAVLKITVPREELNQMMMALQKINPFDFQLGSSDASEIIHRLQRMYEDLTPFWRKVLDHIDALLQH